MLRIVVKIAGEAVLDGSVDREIAREREREHILERLVRELPSRSKTP
jgi:hypothetical protein